MTDCDPGADSGLSWQAGQGEGFVGSGNLERILEEVSCQGGHLEDRLESLNSLWAIEKDSLVLLKTFGPVVSASEWFSELSEKCRKDFASPQP